MLTEELKQEIQRDVTLARDHADRTAQNRVFRFHIPMLFNAIENLEIKIRNLEEELDYFTETETEPDTNPEDPSEDGETENDN